MSLREKLKLILREHGLTITAVLTSLGLVISTIITSLTGGSAGGSPTPPKNPSKIGEWIKSKLKALARLLERLAGKAAAALPGVIGSIIAGLLNFLKNVVTAAAGHVWILSRRLNCMLGGYGLSSPNVLPELETTMVYDDLVIISVDHLIERPQQHVRR